MQQHPIPQNVTQYQFRLVGDMTLKQFLELALGLLLAYLFFASNLIFIFKWPLIILSILFGAGLAFFPIEDRPLDQWIINFLKAIYAPTRFIWKKTNKIPRLFLFEAHPGEITNTITKTIKAPTLSKPITSLSDLSEEETSIVKSIDSLFNELPPTVPVPSVVSLQHDEIAKPTISIRKLKPQDSLTQDDLHVVPTTKLSSTPTQPQVTQGSQTQPPTGGSVIFTAPTVAPHRSASEGGPTTMSAPHKITLPASPTKPNLITGVVVDSSDKLVENAIVQIIENGGIPARALKTNSLGQFYTSTPLSPGTYIIEVEKTGLTYPPKQLVINDTILSPIELRAS